MIRELALAAALIAVTPSVAGAATPPETPFLRLDPGAHTGVVSSVSVDAAGTLLATASYDKTVRLWSLPDGTEREVLRPPIGPGREGELWAVALTPDGRRVFAAGATGGSWDSTFSIYMFSVRTGRLIGRLAGLPSPVMVLAVSPDAGRLAAGLAVGGIRVWDAHTGRLLYADTAYRGLVRGVAFGRRDDLYSTASDGMIRAYTPNGTRIATVVPRPGGKPWGLAVSPDGGLLAVAFAAPDHAGHDHLEMLRIPALTRAYAPDTSGLAGGGLLAVSWAADSEGGVHLDAAGYARGYATGGRALVIRSWGDYGLGNFHDHPAAGDTILALAGAPGGGAVYGTADPGWGLIDAAGRIVRRPAPPMADLRVARHGMLAVSAHGNRVMFAVTPRARPAGTGQGAASLRMILFDATRSTLCDLTPASAGATASRGVSIGCPASPPDDLAKARLAAPGLTVTSWMDTDGPRLNGRRLQLGPEEFSRSLAVLPDGQGVLLGTDSHLRLYAPNGREIAAAPLPAPAWAVTVNRAGTIAVAALTNGTLSWWRIGGGTGLAERATLFVPADLRRWVLFTPEGLFEASPQGGEQLVGFQFDRGADQPPVWVSFSQAFRLFFAPRAVLAWLDGNPKPAEQRLSAFGNIRSALLRKPEAEVVAACFPEAAGVCRNVALQQAAALKIPPDAQKIRLTLQLAGANLGVGPIDLFVNGRNVGRFAGPERAAGAAPSENIVVPLDPGPDQVAFRVYNRSATVFSTTPVLDLVRSRPAPPPEPAMLFILAIGIDHFAAPSLMLRYAVPDARSFVNLMREAAAPIYPRIKTILLTDESATRAGILATLQKLGNEIRPRDTFFLYVASHGAVDPENGHFLLAPSDLADLANWQDIEKGAIDENTLIGALAGIRARDALLFIDTCYSGDVTADALANVSHEVGRYVISASSSVQEALDSYDNHNGVMIYALRQGLEGAAPHGRNGVIGALSLGEYLSTEIAQLARRRGHAQDAEFKAAQRDLISFPVAELLARAGTVNRSPGSPPEQPNSLPSPAP